VKKCKFRRTKKQDRAFFSEKRNRCTFLQIATRWSIVSNTSTSYSERCAWRLLDTA